MYTIVKSYVSWTTDASVCPLLYFLYNKFLENIVLIVASNESAFDHIQKFFHNIVKPFVLQQTNLICARLWLVPTVSH
jgi:hypothetical protein